MSSELAWAKPNVWCVGISKATALADGGNAPVPIMTPEEKFIVDDPVGATKLLVTNDAPKTTLPEGSALKNGCTGPVAVVVTAASEGRGVAAGW